MQTRTFRRTLGAVLLATAAAACETGTATPAVDTVIIEADDSQVIVGGNLQLRATAYDEAGDIITGRPVIWTSSDHNIATVGPSGLLTGLQPGTVDITAQIGGEQDTETFNVVSLCPVTPYTIGTSVNAILASTDCTFQDGTYVDYYGFMLANPRQVTITLRSAQIDAYLVLFSSASEVIEEDDNDGGGTDAQIVRTLPPGTYYIGANSFAIQTGPYTLTTAAAP